MAGVTIYLDTSALAKLAVSEPESTHLRQWLRERTSVPLVTNSIGVVELRRLAARINQEALSTAVRLLARIGVIGMTPDALTLAAEIPPPEVRILDALHIASAALLSDLQAVVTYDQRMATAAIAFGLPVAAPGQ
jgi:predicted nucleic acid-binding protein